MSGQPPCDLSFSAVASTLVAIQFYRGEGLSPWQSLRRSLKTPRWEVGESGSPLPHHIELIADRPSRFHKKTVFSPWRPYLGDLRSGPLLYRYLLQHRPAAPEPAAHNGDVPQQRLVPKDRYAVAGGVVQQGVCDG